MISAAMREILSSRFPTMSNTNQTVLSQKMASGLKVQIKEGEGLCYICSENKDADQLHCYLAADLYLCFHTCKKQVFS